MSLASACHSGSNRKLIIIDISESGPLRYLSLKNKKALVVVGQDSESEKHVLRPSPRPSEYDSCCY